MSGEKMRMDRLPRFWPVLTGAAFLVACGVSDLTVQEAKPDSGSTGGATAGTGATGQGGDGGNSGSAGGGISGGGTAGAAGASKGGSGGVGRGGSGAGGAPVSCTPNATVVCSELADGTPIVFPGGSPKGNCHMGTRHCVNGTLSACEGAVAPAAADTCVANDDASCNGTKNEGCACISGQASTCSTALGAQGVCAPGQVTCDASGQWSACSISPTAEVCDDLDNNCAGGVDEGCDDDNDNYCDAAMVRVGSPVTCTAGGGDCADTDAAKHPGAAEICNNLDDNCSGAADETFACRLTASQSCTACGHSGTQTCAAGCTLTPCGGFGTFSQLYDDNVTTAFTHTCGAACDATSGDWCILNPATACDMISGGPGYVVPVGKYQAEFNFGDIGTYDFIVYDGATLLNSITYTNASASTFPTVLVPFTVSTGCANITVRLSAHAAARMRLYSVAITRLGD